MYLCICTYEYVYPSHSAIPRQLIRGLLLALLKIWIMRDIEGLTIIKEEAFVNINNDFVDVEKGVVNKKEKCVVR